MATELFQNDTIPRLTWANVFNQSQEGLEVAPVASGGETMIAPTIIGGIFQGASYRSGDSGARFEIFPEEDKNIGCVVYNASGTVVFKTIIDGTDTGDVIVGDYAGGAGAKWDQSASSFDVKGGIITTSGTIGGWTIVSGYIYNLQSGTPGSTENDGMVLASGNTGMTVWENTEKRLELGYLSSGVYGLRIYDTSGSNVIFETSDTQQSISGWHFTTTTLADNATAASANVLIDSANSLIRLGPTAGTYISIDGANQKLESSNYVSGHAGAGFHLDSNLLEVGNIAARGLIRTAVFQKDVISSIGGNFMVADSDVLDANMTALDASSLTTKETTTFELGDILRIKDGTDDEWLEVIARTVDSYSESNQSQEGILYSGSTVKMGQSFTGNGNILYSGKLYLKKSGSPVGNATMTVYAHTGTFGSDGTPTGSALATSDNFDVSTLTTSFALITFSFTGANRITLTNGTNYFVILEYGGGDVSNSVRIGVDNTSPSHGGNAVYYVSSWAALTDDACFYVYGAGSPYAINRDKNSDYAADTNPIWKKGATVVNYGASGDGGIFMTASETNAPYLSIFDHAGSPWDTINTRLRIGNLNGYLGYSTDLYGIAIGETGNSMTYDPTNGLRITGTITGGTIAIGTGNNIFKADANGIYLGNATFANAPFKVNMAGALVATSATITGAIQSGSTIDGTTITGSTLRTGTSGANVYIESSRLSLRDDATEEVYMDISTYGGWFGLKDVNGTGALALYVRNADRDISFIMGASSDLFIQCDNIYAVTGTGWLAPGGDNQAYCGITNNAWNTVTSYVFADLCSMYDEIDDIQAIKNIKAKKGKFDEYGFPKMDLESLPIFLQHHDSSSKKTFRNLGRMVDLTLGAIKQLDKRLEALEK